MSFAVVTDSLAGLPLEEVASRGLVVIPLSYYMNGEEHTCQAPEERDNGVGIQLIGKAVSLSRPLDCDKLGLVCSEQNAHALAFYQKYGFHTIGTEAGAYGTLYRMQKDIGYTVREDLM